MSNSDFFDKHSSRYFESFHFVDEPILKIIKENDGFSSLLDVGGGAGGFAQAVVDYCPNVKVTVIDPSQELLSYISDKRIMIICGALPDYKLENKYNYIHIKEVLHHITGNSIKESKDKVIKTLESCYDALETDGYLFLNEDYYEGWISYLPRTVIFYLLRLQNKIGIRIPAEEFVLGLSVCFYTRRELKMMLELTGYRILETLEYKWKENLKTKALMLKNRGRITFIAKKINKQ